ncbi:uncharacterized protein HaLaN_23700 [Haematococcus lacustris]|uniref:Uncharacterized protein n=1 Tax=Haematococcus lacustris TaxID=44745 RepID=A0A699ZUS7_HAELA|nr:uncharacterized protein HaLaN_23700 [Haematococcus lacustris]
MAATATLLAPTGGLSPAPAAGRLTGWPPLPGCLPACVCVQEVVAGRATVGDLVMVNGLLFQASIAVLYSGDAHDEAAVVAMTAIPAAQLPGHSLPGDQAKHAGHGQLVCAAEGAASHPGPARSQATDVECDVEFKEVRFGYRKDHPPILDGVTFKVPAGKRCEGVAWSRGCHGHDEHHHVA